MKIVALDPGTKSGVTITNGTVFETQLWDVKAKPKTKKHPGEPKHYRLFHLWELLEQYAWDAKFIVCEGALGFLRGQSAVEASHKYRAVIELFSILNAVELVMIEPNDLKFFALGKRSGDKREMIQAAQRLGYVGNSDDEADSYLMAKWFVANRMGVK
ncbi:MAG: hypothetical protein ABIL06_13130 [Pseudomonadota bacterium]|uniref:Holliday junction resolvase RuvC n=1 Tax=viral metagenome TaxID=1070528 RepID=A0A6H1ZHT8_9ZZZZ